ncbi:MAG: glycoside hydrolase family 97 N-terminal domain-containing protein [Planctomycetes bacterium]|nr:glycoside hydrolase family 97 N-terminal domain-containing protein [Planctomycetota bacterium]MBL7044578.1 glycoside hydrolase family 97 N-terminal domain-containing protein [Pirellulaceae bacterium]
MRASGEHAIFVIVLLLAGNASAADLKSPDGDVVVSVDISDDGALQYAVKHRGKPLLIDSRLGLELQDAPTLGQGCNITGITHGTHDETWKPVYGERSEIRDHYNQMVVDLQDSQRPPRQLRLTFRAYDEGIAFCYTVPKQGDWQKVDITKEISEFRFADDHTAWAVYSAQGRYAEVPLSGIKPGCERPLTLRIDDQTFAAVGEARLVDYARMKLAPLDGVPHALVSQLTGPVEAALPLTTPWRVVMVADSPGQLLEYNDIFLNLNDPCAIADTSWIKPGKVIREVTLSTTGGKACVDFAERHNLQYVEFDAGWYGHEYSDESDARTVTVDPKRSPGPLDLPEVIRYAGEHGIGILVYVNRRALDRQLDEILPLYQSWGIKGVKYGFVNVGSQQATRWLHEAVRKAAAHRLMVDAHDEYRPTGYSRTYPNFMTQEGIGGDETSPTNRQTLTILFTRMLVGAGDNTICYYDARVDRNASHAYQLAKAVCLYSPWQFLYWYDRPPRSPQEKGGAGGSKHLIGNEPELEFFDHVPTVWDETRVIHGRIGQYAMIARRSGQQWFIGCMNADEPRTLEIPLDFLAKNERYTAHIYRDDENVSTRTHVRIERRPVDAKTILTVSLSAKGGQAIRIVPAAES